MLNTINGVTYTVGLDMTGINYEVVDINATGHYPIVEKPEEFNKLLKQTIKKIEAAHKIENPVLK